MPQSSFPARVALVIDGDKKRRTETVGKLRSLGVRQVESAVDGWDALQLVEKSEFDLIIQDWHTTGVGGFNLLSRIKCDARHLLKPFVAASASLPVRDFAIAQDFPCLAFAEAPLSDAKLLSLVKELDEQRQWYDGKQQELKKLLAAFAYGQEAISNSFEALMLGAPAQLTLCLITARALRQEGAFDAAEKILRRALAQMPESPLAQGELGKIQLRQRRYDEALATLSKALGNAPRDIQRLCLEEPIDMNFSQVENLRASIKKALRLEVRADNGGDFVMQGMRSMQEYFRRKAELEPFPHSYASLCNALTIAQVRTNKHERALLNYQAALVYAYDDRASAKVAFNIGLCYLRWQKPERAKSWFDMAVTLSSASLPRAASFGSRLQLYGKGSSSNARAAADRAERDGSDIIPQSGKLIELAERRRRAATETVAEKDKASTVAIDELDFEDEKFA